MVSATMAKTVRLMTCERCGQECERRGGRQRFCPSCREEGNKAAIRHRDRMRRPSKTTIGETLKCVRCGVDVIRKQAKQKLCAPCLPKYWAEVKAERAALRLAEKGIIVGASFACEDCGEILIRKTASHKFCDCCAGTRMRESADRSRERALEKFRKRTREWRKSAAGREWMENYRNLPENKLHSNMSRAIRASIAGKGGRSWESLLGYTTEQLMAHIERQFTRGMTWENYGEWHIDHIRPKVSFGLLSSEDPAFKECWAMSNLQPLWAEDNRRKSAKLAFLV